MKLTRNEFGHDYTTYRFGYCEYATYEKGDRVADIYEKGFLPYSATPEVTAKGVFYMARSARVRLREFEFTSENRRIGKHFDGMFTFRILTIPEAKKDSRIRALFLEYFRKKHGDIVMPPARFDAIMDTPLPLRVFIYEKDGELVAAALEVFGETFGHFWFSAYDLDYVKQSLGMWLMLDGAQRAKEAGRSHYYIGTVYGARALYKTNLRPVEFWDGISWNTNLNLLKKLARAESK